MATMHALRRAASRIVLAAAGLLPLSPAAAQAQPSSEITIVKEVEPDDVTDFFFTLSGPTPGGAQLDDDAAASGGNNNAAKSKSFAVAPGAYTITEQDPGPGWSFAGAKCTGPAGSSVDLPNRTVERDAAIELRNQRPQRLERRLDRVPGARPPSARDKGGRIRST